MQASPIGWAAYRHTNDDRVVITTTDLGLPPAPTTSGLLLRWFELFAVAVITIGVLRVLKVYLSKYLVTRVNGDAFTASVRSVRSPKTL